MAGEQFAAIVTERLGENRAITLVADRDEVMVVRPDVHLGWRGSDPTHSTGG